MRRIDVSRWSRTVLALSTVLLLVTTGCPSEPGSSSDNDGNDETPDPDPTLTITDAPDESVVLDDGEAELDFRFETEGDCGECATECAFGPDGEDGEFDDCDEDQGFSTSVDADGDHRFQVRLRDDSEVHDAVTVDVFGPDFGLDADIPSDYSNSSYVHGEYLPYCQRQDRDECVLRCRWEEAQDAHHCAAGEPYHPVLPEEWSTLNIEACPELDSDDSDCVGPMEHEFLHQEPEWNVVSAGHEHSCAILNQDHSLWCWGANDDNQLGIGDAADDSEIVDQPRRVLVDGDEQPGWLDVSAGQRHTCAITEIDSAGDLYCWGHQSDGQLGLGASADVATDIPAPLGEGDDWVSISAGGAHSCAVNEDDEIYCWGANDHGEVGNDTTSTVVEPTQVEPPVGFEWFGDQAFPGWAQVSTGQSHTCGLSVDPNLAAPRTYCWGDNSAGQLGNEDRADNEYEPRPVGAGGLADKTGISAGGYHSCSIWNEERAYCWGDNSRGQLGIDDTDDPGDGSHEVEFDGEFSSISAGAEHTCAIDPEYDHAYCWGLNFDSQLGMGSDFDDADEAQLEMPVPVNLDDEQQVTDISAGSDHTCAIADDELYCWGRGSDGRLGTASTDTQDSPAPINWPFYTGE